MSHKIGLTPKNFCIQECFLPEDQTASTSTFDISTDTASASGLSGSPCTSDSKQPSSFICLVEQAKWYWHLQPTLHLLLWCSHQDRKPLQNRGLTSQFKSVSTFSHSRPTEFDLFLTNISHHVFLLSHYPSHLFLLHAQYFSIFAHPPPFFLNILSLVHHS